MGAGILALPFILIFIYIIPIWLTFYKSISKTIRIIIGLIPVIFTFSFVLYALTEDYRAEKIQEQFPQINKITFKDPSFKVRDSIFQLQKIMAKLPAIDNHNGIHYRLDKHPDRYNEFSFNMFLLGNLNYL